MQDADFHALGKAEAVEGPASPEPLTSPFEMLSETGFSGDRARENPDAVIISSKAGHHFPGIMLRYGIPTLPM